MKPSAQGDVSLRDVIQSDLPVFFEQQRDPDAVRMAAFPDRDEDAFYTHWAKILADAKLGKQTIVFRGRVAGNIVSFEQSGRSLVGYWLGQEYWGRGIATRALRAYLERHHVRPLYASVAPHNVASRRVLEKCGFTVHEQSAEEILMELRAEAEKPTPSSRG